MNQIEVSKLQPHQRYLLKFVEGGHDYSASEDESFSSEESSDEDKEIVTLECEFIKYFDSTYYSAYCKYHKGFNNALNAGATADELPDLPQELQFLHYPLTEEEDTPFLLEREITDALYPYRRIMFKGFPNYCENNFTYLTSNVIIGLFKVIKIRHPKNVQEIYESNPAIKNTVVAEGETDNIIKEESYIWVDLDGIDGIIQPVRDSQVANTIQKLAYNGRRDNPYSNLNQKNPPIPQEVIDHEIYPSLGLGRNHVNKSLENSRPRSRDRSLSRGSNKDGLRSNSNRGRDRTKKYTNNSVHPNKTRKLHYRLKPFRLIKNRILNNKKKSNKNKPKIKTKNKTRKLRHQLKEVLHNKSEGNKKNSKQKSNRRNSV